MNASSSVSNLRTREANSCTRVVSSSKDASSVRRKGLKRTGHLSWQLLLTAVGLVFSQQSLCAQEPREIRIPDINRNALTPADKNYGYTGIYLINRKSIETKTQTIKPVQSSTTPKVTSSKTPPKLPENAVLINSGDDAPDESLLKINYHGIDDRDSIMPALFDPDSQDKRIEADHDSSITLASTGNVPTPNHVIQVSGKRHDFYVFTNNGQSISNQVIGSDHPLLIGSKGTYLSTNDHVLVLHTGKILLDSGNSDLVVGNREVGIKLARNSTAYIEYIPQTKLLVSCVGGKSADAIKVRPASRKDTTYSLKQGEELVLDRAGTNKKTFSVKELVASNPLFQIPSSFNKSLHTRLKNHLGDEIALPVGQPLPPPTAPVRVMAAKGSQFYCSAPGELHFVTGWIFVEAPKGTQVVTDMGKVSVNKPADVNIEQIPGYFRVGSCTGGNAVEVDSGNYKAQLDSGEEVLYCDHDPHPSEITAGDGILRRELQLQELQPDKFVVFGDFSIYSLLYNCNHLHALRLGANKTDRDARERLIRTIASLQYATSDRGDYQEKPQVSRVSSVRTK